VPDLAVETDHGVYRIDLDTEEVTALEEGMRVRGPELVETGLPRVVAAAAAGSTVVAVVDRRPPVVVSYDAGRTWRETGGGLPRGRAVAVHADDPDLVVYAARNRVFVSRDGGRFWHALAPELPEITAVTFEG
jgi:hypothetical protein